MADVTVEQIADAIFKMVSEAEGKKNLKPGDCSKAMIKQFGVDKQMCKDAIRILVDSGRLTYSYFGGSYLTLPKVEGAAKGLD